MATAERQPVTAESKRARWVRIGIVAALVALLTGRWLADHTADRLWAASLGVAGAHAGIAQLRLMLLALAFCAGALWCVGNVYLFYRSIGSVHVPRRVGNIEFLEAVPRRYLLAGALVVGLLLAVVVSHSAQGWWMAEALVDEGPGLGVRDPILGYDLGYYLFVLPWYRTLHGFATVLTGTILAVITLLYIGVGAIRWNRRHLHVSELARMHLAGLFAAFALALFWGYRLEPQEYVAGLHGVSLDATLLEVRIPVARLLGVLGLVAAAVSLAWLWIPNVGFMVAAWTVLFIVSLIGHHVLPVVSASVRGRDTVAGPDMERAVAEMERVAYGLERHDSSTAPPAPRDARALARHRDQLRSAPVWDPAAVVRSLNIIPRPEAYVRYFEGSLGLGLYRSRKGEPVPVYLAAREVDLSTAREADRSLSWEATHTVPYGHANGVVAVAAAAAAEDGSLMYLPSVEPADSQTPRLTEVVQADREVLFSPAAGDFAIMTGTPSDFAGVRAGGLARRVALAWALQSPRLVTSELLTPDALIVWERQITPRLARFAPFADFGVPYPVIARGRLYWLASGYVTAEVFPLSRMVRWRGHTVRYVRPGLIGVVDARSGMTSVYLMPSPDPLSAAWARRAPEIVRPFRELGRELAGHVRYPEELFEIQLALIRGPVLSPETPSFPPAPPSVPARAMRGGATESQARRNRPLWWSGPWAGDTVSRVRVLARFESEESSTLTGLVEGTMIEGSPSLEITRFSPALELAGSAQITRRLADVRTPTVGVTGARRVVVLNDGILTVQSTYATGQGPWKLVDVVLQWGAIVVRGNSLPAAIDQALALREDGGAGADWSTARRWFERLEQARQRGDWTAFGRAYDALRRLLLVQ
ncbi:MAG: UPF0182 family protein [Gemmatimonadetes bacterium]|nr:UPF0182 family protein [Gemmatimonadota bacterium]